MPSELCAQSRPETRGSLLKQQPAAYRTLFENGQGYSVEGGFDGGAGLYSFAFPE
jgi:hypothetical protein